MNRWEVNGRTIAMWRCAAGYTHEKLAEVSGIEKRIIVGVERGYWRFKDQEAANKFATRIQEVCKEKVENDRIGESLTKKEAV